VQAYGLPTNADDDRRLREVIYHLLKAQASQVTSRSEPGSRTLQVPSAQALRKSQELLQKNHPYNGSQKTEAAHNWLMQCENFFADEVKMGFLEQTDAQKIVSASGALVSNAKKVWENHVRSSQAQHVEAISTWQAFREWILWHFEPTTAEWDRFAAFEACHQRDGESLQDYWGRASNLVARLAEPLGEPHFLNHVQAHLRSDLKQEWIRRTDRATSSAEVFRQLQDIDNSLCSVRREKVAQGRPSFYNRRRHGGTPGDKTTSEGGDAMDLNAVTASRPNGACWNCYGKGHIARDCPEKKNPQQAGKARGQ
jgi:hypothetical protein